MKKWLRRSLIVLIALVAASQFVRPEKTNPGSDPKDHIQAVLPVHQEVAGVLSRSCNDCHSNNTVWPWYSNVAPASWLITKDVQEGREEMNFSAWGKYQGEKQQELLGEICKQVSSGEMPGAAYALMHPKAKLTDSERSSICAWTKSVAPTMAAEHEERGDED